MTRKRHCEAPKEPRQSHKGLYGIASRHATLAVAMTQRRQFVVVKQPLYGTIFFLLLALFMAGCAIGKKGPAAQGGVVRLNFTPDRIVDVFLVRKFIKKEKFFAFGGKSVFADFVEGYIIGKVVDEAGVAVEGVRVEPVNTSNYTAGVSDYRGEYRVRFSLPVVAGEAQGETDLQFNRGWESELRREGSAFRPVLDKPPHFKVYYDKSKKVIFLNEGELSREVRVRRVTSAEVPTTALAPGATTTTQAPVKKQEKPPPSKKEKSIFDQLEDFNFPK